MVSRQELQCAGRVSRRTRASSRHSSGTGEAERGNEASTGVRRPEDAKHEKQGRTAASLSCVMHMRQGNDPRGGAKLLHLDTRDTAKLSRLDMRDTAKLPRRRRVLKKWQR